MLICLINFYFYLNQIKNINVVPFHLPYLKAISNKKTLLRYKTRDDRCERSVNPLNLELCFLPDQWIGSLPGSRISCPSGTVCCVSQSSGRSLWKFQSDDFPLHDPHNFYLWSKWKNNIECGDNNKISLFIDSFSFYIVTISSWF